MPVTLRMHGHPIEKERKEGSSSNDGGRMFMMLLNQSGEHSCWGNTVNVGQRFMSFICIISKMFTNFLNQNRTIIPEELSVIYVCINLEFIIDLIIFYFSCNVRGTICYLHMYQSGVYHRSNNFLFFMQHIIQS